MKATWRIVVLKTDPPQYMPKLSVEPMGVPLQLGPTFKERGKAENWVKYTEAGPPYTEEDLLRKGSPWAP